MWKEADDLVDNAATDIYIKCPAESPCAVEYYKNHKWTEFHGVPLGLTVTLFGTPLADGPSVMDLLRTMDQRQQTLIVLEFVLRELIALHFITIQKLTNVNYSQTMKIGLLLLLLLVYCAQELLRL